MNFIENESATKLRGGYYTQPSIARFLARWALERRPQAVLEPGCGDGAFLAALAAEGGAGRRAVLAFERDPAEARKAAQRARGLPGLAARVIRGDYLEWSLRHLGEAPPFDAAVGNPPFVRYQYLDERSQQLAERLFEALGLPFTWHTNAWVPFVLAALGQLRPGGRLAMVVPAELLHVLHAQSLRDHLVATCARVAVLDPQELWFDQALQGVVLLLAEKAETAESGCRLAIVPVRGRAFLEGAPQDLLAAAEPEEARPGGGKWMRLMLTRPERAALDEVRAHPSVHPFAEVAQVDVGIVTGANKFFLVPDAVVQEYELERWARPMFGRSEHVRGVVYDEARHAENRALGLPTNFIHFGAAPRAALSAGARRYIRLGEADRLDARYKCRIRTPWYSVPSVRAAPVAMLKRAHDFPRLVLNRCRALTTDTAYRVAPAAGVDAERLVGAFVNSTTLLTAELEGRHYGGGVLELVPSEIEKLLVPVPTGPALLADLDDGLRAGAGCEELVEAQDGRVLAALGLSGAVRARLFGAWSRLRRRRQRGS